MKIISSDSSSRCAVLLARVINSDLPLLVWLRRLLIVLACVAGLVSVVFGAQSLFSPYVYMKDFIQEYLLARAVLSGVSPYLPIPVLAQRFIGPLPNAVFPHPTPHPPPVVIIAAPLGLLQYQQAAIVWFIFEFLCVLTATYILFTWLRMRTNVWWLLLSTLVLFSWNPFREILIFGQLTSLLLVLLLLSWQSLRAGQAIRGGLFLGLVVALKLLGWPIVLFLALRRNWRATGAAVVTGIIMNTIAVLLIGYQAVLHYYTQVGSTVSSLYRAYVFNFSLWSVGWRLFDGTGSVIIAGAEAPPIWNAPILARGIAWSLPLLFLILGLYLAYEMRDFDVSFAILVCVSILVNPVAWAHYLVIALLPLVVLVRLLWGNRCPETETRIAAICGLLLLISHRQWHELAVLLDARIYGGGSVMVNPWILSTLTLLPAGLLFFVIWLLYRLGSNASTTGRVDIAYN
jgi:hypothetical protein